MKKALYVIAVLFLLGAFAAPAFAVVNANYSVVAVDDEPAKKDASKSDSQSDKKHTEKKGECTKSEEKKAECAKEKKAECTKEKPACDKK